MKIIPLWDRSRCLTDWKCPRARFWNYEFQGTGIVPEGVALELYLGTCLHDALASIAYQHPTVDIDTIARTAQGEVYNTLSNNGEALDLLYVMEQASLIEGLIRGFYKHAWGSLIAQYPLILHVEKELTHALPNGQTFMAKPDLILGNEAGEVVYCEYKSTSSKKEDWINQWTTAVQVHSTIKAIKSSLNLDISAVIIQGLYKGYCLTPETKILTADLRWDHVGNLKEGDRIAGFEEEPNPHVSGRKKSRQWKEATVTGTGRLKLPCYKLTFEDGSIVTCSEQHKWLAAWRTEGTGTGRWVETKDLVPYQNGYVKGHRIIKVIEPWDLNKVDSYTVGYLAGAFDGEGNLSQHQTKGGWWLTHVGFTQNPNPVLERVGELLQQLNIKYSVQQRSSVRVQNIVIYGKENVMRFLGLTQPVRLLPKFSFDRLGGMNPCVAPVRLVKKEFIGIQEVVALQTSTQTLVAEGFASHNTSYGKQSSPFCYAYSRFGNPPFTQAEIRYEYAAGFRRTPVWELEGGVKSWVENMPLEILANQFPQSPPIFINDALVDAFFRQRAIREGELDTAMQLLEGADPVMAQMVMDSAFPQRFDQCQPGWGRNCAYRPLCHGSIHDPLTAGFTPRVPHHQPEADAWTER